MPAPRQKINDNFREQEGARYGYNRLHRRFRDVFDILLNPHSPAVEWCEPNAGYVRMPAVENMLKDFSESSRDSVCILKGYTGIGKSTVIRHVFKTRTDAPVIEGSTLTIPVFLLRRFSIDHLVARTLASTADRLSDAFSITSNREELYQELQEYRPDLLQYGDTLPDQNTSQQKLEALLRSYPEAYHLHRLKVLLTKSQIKRVMLLLDDIETQIFSAQEELIRQLLMVHSGLATYRDRGYVVNLLIALRPNTVKLLNRQEWFRAYVVDEKIDFFEAVSLVDLFLPRFEFHARRLKVWDSISQKAKWQEAYNTLVTLADSISGKVDNAVVRMSNCNVREALLHFARVVANKYWLEKPEAAAASEPSLDHYHKTEGFLLRALALGNRTIYTSQDCPVRNLLHNGENPKTDLLATYFYRYFRGLESSLRYEYQLATEQKACEMLALHLPWLVGEESDSLKNCLTFMQEEGLLEEEVTRSDALVHLFLLPRAHGLWHMLRESSIVFELLRDDTFMPFPRNLFHPTARMPEEDRWQGVVDSARVIANTEGGQLQAVAEKGLATTFKNIFGSDLVCAQIAQGIRYSSRAYFSEGIPQWLETELRRLSDLVGEIQRILKTP